MLPETLYKCLENDCIVAVATADVDGHPHLVNTWNKYVMVTKDDELLIPCAGYRKTESNIKSNPYVEITIGSPEVKGKKYLGTGFLLTGTAEFQSEGLFLSACIVFVSSVIALWCLPLKPVSKWCKQHTIDIWFVFRFLLTVPLLTLQYLTTCARAFRELSHHLALHYLAVSYAAPHRNKLR